MDDVNNAMPQMEPADFDAPKYIDPEDAEANTEALQIVNDTTLTNPQKIDRMAEIRNWFSGDTTRIDAYLASETTSATAFAAELAAPIDEAYSTADHGIRYSEAEKVARTQRKYYSPEKALELWGPERELEEPAEEVKNKPGTENQLWDLWYSVLHAAKKIPWEDEERQGKLLDLVKALKARPDPPLPEPMTAAVKRDWIWSAGKLWSVNLMLGPSARESWNDSCGCGAGWTPVDTAAWTNVNAFVARMVASGVVSMFYSYGEWALGELEHKWSDQYSHEPGEDEVIRETNLSLAALWVIIAGRQIYEQREKDSHGVDAYEIDINRRGDNFPWIRYKQGVTGARWTWWKRRFEQEIEDESLPARVKELAAKAAQLIQGFEKDVDNNKA